MAIDVHNPHPAIALQLIEALAPHRPLFVEEPMPVERVEALAQCVHGARASVPIAAGERWMGKWIFFDALRRGPAGGGAAGPLPRRRDHRVQKIAAMAEAAYAKVALHCPLSPLAFAASIQLDATAQLPRTGAQRGQRLAGGRRTYMGKGFLRSLLCWTTTVASRSPRDPASAAEIDDEGMEEIMARPWSTARG